MANSHRASRGLGHTQDTLRKSRRVTALSLCRSPYTGLTARTNLPILIQKIQSSFSLNFSDLVGASVVTEQGSALAPFLPSYAQRLEILDALHGKGHT
jgi:hypothetical protein